MEKLKLIDGHESKDCQNSYIEEVKLDDRIVPVVKYKIFEAYDEVLHGFSTRLGGVSLNHLASMNLSFSRGDIYDNVITNHKIFAKALGYDENKLVFSDQIHKCDIHVVTREDAGRGIVSGLDKLTGIDGLVTNERDIPLITFYADCVPLFFYDEARHVVALAHSGWRGTVANIAKAMVDKMSGVYGSKSEDIICAIGPSICVSCYEVSTDVALEFKNRYDDVAIKNILYYKGNDKYQLDLHQACRYNLLGAGIKESHIAMPDYCTCCNPDVFYSHRASHDMRGNLAAVIMLKDK